MSNLPPHEATAHRVIHARQKQSHRFHRTMAGLGIATGIAAGIAGNADHELLAASIVVSGTIGTTKIATKERNKSITSCNDTVDEIAYLNNLEYVDALREPGTSEIDQAALPPINRHNMTRYFAPLGGFVVFNVLSGGPLMQDDTASNLPVLALVPLLCRAVYIDNRLDALSAKTNTLAYEKQLFNVSLLHDATQA